MNKCGNGIMKPRLYTLTYKFHVILNVTTIIILLIYLDHLKE